MFRAVTFVALVAYASAQSISSQCLSSITGIVQNTDAATCLSATSLIPVISGSSSSASLIGPINNWLTNLCAAPACSNATLAAVVQNITTGCADDLSALGFTPSLTPDITNLVEQYYPTVRQVVCLKDGSTNCITQTLTNIQNLVGQLNLTTVSSLATGSSLADIPTNITCTNCIKAIYNDINKAFPSAATTAVPALQSQCGASFTDGATPSGIVESANTAAAASSSSAALGDVSLLSRGVFTGLSLSSLVVVTTWFTLLA
ncbi:hypothetical protein BYT27DRAFT_7102184 [Phlegmacium glaucopus]|nr:hypothetical protein BYT27DRAFT_7102184 [Phlegmacium glaucopus]